MESYLYLVSFPMKVAVDAANISLPQVSFKLQENVRKRSYKKLNFDTIPNDAISEEVMINDSTLSSQEHCAGQEIVQNEKQLSDEVIKKKSTEAIDISISSPPSIIPDRTQTDFENNSERVNEVLLTDSTNECFTEQGKN